eukprot:403371858
MAARFGVGGGANNRRSSNAMFIMNRKPKDKLIGGMDKRASKITLTKTRSSESYPDEHLPLQLLMEKRFSTDDQHLVANQQFRRSNNDHQLSQFAGNAALNGQNGNLGSNANNPQTQNNRRYDSFINNQNHSRPRLSNLKGEAKNQSLRQLQQLDFKIKPKLKDIPKTGSKKLFEFKVSALQESKVKIESARNPVLRKLGDYLKNTIKEKIAKQIMNIGILMQQQQNHINDKEVDQRQITSKVSNLVKTKLLQMTLQEYKKYREQEVIRIKQLIQKIKQAQKQSKKKTKIQQQSRNSNSIPKAQTEILNQNSSKYLAYQEATITTNKSSFLIAKHIWYEKKLINKQNILAY